MAAHELGMYEYRVHVKTHMDVKDMLVFDRGDSSLMGFSSGEGIAIVYTTRKQMRQFAQTLAWITSYEEQKQIEPPTREPQEDIVFEPPRLNLKKIADALKSTALHHWFIWIKPDMVPARVAEQVQKLGPGAYVDYKGAILHLIARDEQITNFCKELNITTDCRRGAKVETK